MVDVRDFKNIARECWNIAERWKEKGSKDRFAFFWDAGCEYMSDANRLLAMADCIWLHRVKLACGGPRKVIWKLRGAEHDCILDNVRIYRR